MDEYLRRLRDGTLKLYALEKELAPADAVSIRRKFIEEETGVPLDRIGDCTISLDAVVKKNCENMIGTIQVPLGVAGPVRIKGEYADGTMYSACNHRRALLHQSTGAAALLQQQEEQMSEY